MRKFRFLLAPLAAAVLAACAVGPNYEAPTTPSAAKFDGVEATYSTEAAVADFWQKFDDPMLAGLVDQALTSNYDLRIALSRIAEARALRRDVAFDLAPSIQARGATPRPASRANRPSPARRAAPSTTTPASMLSGSSTSSVACAEAWRRARHSSAPSRRAAATRWSSSPPR
jgi:outer membrane protein TolC